MAVILKLKCPDCAETFRWPGGQKWPDYCPLCQADLRPDNDGICMPFISTSGKSQSVDKVYRDMEKGSEVRAQLAADMLGASAADVAHLKTTNLRETVAGESPYVPVVNDVTRSMAINQQATGFQPSQGVEYSGAVQQGPFPNMGAKTISAIRQLHATRGGGYGSMSDNPAKEVLQPGSRRRA